MNDERLPTDKRRHWTLALCELNFTTLSRNADDRFTCKLHVIVMYQSITLLDAILGTST